MSKAPRGKAAMRPSTADNSPLEDAEPHPEEDQLNTALHVIEVFAEVRQMGICHGANNCLLPKELAAYSAALHRLETYMDGNC